MKKILVISDAIGAPLYAPRVRFLCDYLQKNGYDVTLAIEQTKPLPFAYDYRIVEAIFYRRRGILGKVEWVWKNFLSLLFDYKNRFFCQRFYRIFKNSTFDCVLVSTFHTFGLRAGQKIAQKNHAKFIVDLRDIAEQVASNEYNVVGGKSPKWIEKYYRKINICRRNCAIKTADALVSVSPWHVEFLNRFNEHVHLIYNGFDADLFVPKMKKNDKFTITYAGKLYGQTLQNPEIFYFALQNLLRRDLIAREQLRVVWYTAPECQIRLKKDAEAHNLTAVFEYHDYVPNDQVPQLLNASSVVLVLTNAGTHGIMTTKFFEALGCERPVLCVRSDEDCLERVIKETNAGIAAKTVEEVEQFLLEKYAEWQRDGFTHQLVNQQLKSQFSRQKQAEQFAELFEKC